MATKDTGFDEMYGEEDVAQSNGLDTAVEAAGAEMTGDTPAADSVSAAPDAGRPEDAGPVPISPSDAATVDAGGTMESDSTMAETEIEPLEEAPTYSQEDVDQLKDQYERDLQFCKKRLREVENELSEKDVKLHEKNEKIQSLSNDSCERDKIRDQIFSLVGDIGSPAKTYEVVKMALQRFVKKFIGDFGQSTGPGLIAI